MSVTCSDKNNSNVFRTNTLANIYYTIIASVRLYDLHREVPARRFISLAPSFPKFETEPGANKQEQMKNNKKPRVQFRNSKVGGAGISSASPP